jgi:hypothetical protein
MLALVFGASGCRVVGGIFKAGALATLVIVILAVALVFGVMRMFRRPV